MGEQGVLREVTDAKLLGRGGAAFPTGRKWAAVAAHPTRPHYLICNADESEPGTFKDRVLLEHDPFSVIEAMTIAGFATGCEHGYLYLRGEYPLAWERLVGAVTEARARGFLGQDIFGRGINFDIELRKGAGAYICGEETALFNSIEGYRGEPRNKPPFPVEHGLFDKPTVINNVETLVNVPGIVLDGGQAYARIGTEDSKGTRLFCLSGRVQRPGLYEAPFGITLREVLDMAGGVIDGRPLRTILLGGAAGPLRHAGRARHRDVLRGDPGGRREHGLGRGHGRRRHGRPARDPHADRRVLPRRVVRAVRAVPRRDRAPGGGARAPDQRASARHAGAGVRAARRDHRLDARLVDLRARPDGRRRDRVRAAQARRLRDGRSTMRTRTGAPPRTVELEMNGETVEAKEDQTILEVAQQQGIEIPTLCWERTLTPVNACRVCVVELEGARVLAPSCARKVEDGMEIQTHSERVNHSRKMVLEFLASSVDLSITPNVARWIEEYGADPERYGPPAPPFEAGERDRVRAGHHETPDGSLAATVHQPTKVDNELYVRDYSKCILCYKCVEGCGTDWQNTFAIAVAGRGFDARIATEFANPLPDSACVYCGNCIAVCPTGALMFKSEYDRRADGRWDEDEQTVDDHDLHLLRRRVQSRAARAGQRDRQGHLAAGPPGHARQPLHQGSLRVPVHPEPRGRGAARVPGRSSSAAASVAVARAADPGRTAMPPADDGETNRGASPVDDEGRVAVAGADGWLYLPFKHDERTGEHEITLVREEDGEEVRFTMPAFVEQGDELGEIALIVIRARERWRELKGVGG